MNVRVSSYMTTNVLTVNPDDSVALARRIMVEKGVCRLVVIDGDERPVGILTMNDIAGALYSRFTARRASQIKVSEIMTRNPVTIEARRSVRTAASLMMKYGVSSLPVVDAQGRLTGLLTKTSIVRAFRDRMRGEYRVGDVMRTNFARVQRDHNIYYVAKLLNIDEAGKVLVFDGDRLIGVISKKDLQFITGAPRAFNVIRGRLASIYAGGSSRKPSLPPLLAEEVMTPHPLTIEPDRDAAEAADTMVAEGVGVLPVLDGGRVVGVVSKNDIVKVVAARRRPR